MQVQEYCVEEHFPHGRNLLNQFDLNGFVPRTATRPEPMEGIVLGKGGIEVMIEYHCHRLPQDLQDTYAKVVPAPFILKYLTQIIIKSTWRKSVISVYGRWLYLKKHFDT